MVLPMLEKLKNLKKASRNYEKKMKKLEKQFARLDEITSSLQGTLNNNQNRMYSYGK